MAKALYDSLCVQVQIGRRTDEIYRHKHMPDGTIVTALGSGNSGSGLSRGNYQFDKLQRKSDDA